MMLKQRGRKDLKEGGPGFYRSLAFFKRYGHLMLFLDQVLPLEISVSSCSELCLSRTFVELVLLRAELNARYPTWSFVQHRTGHPRPNRAVLLDRSRPNRRRKVLPL